jgi:hypothetical protein
MGEGCWLGISRVRRQSLLALCFYGLKRYIWNSARLMHDFGL